MYRHIPNILSAFRILLVPIFAATYFSPLDNGRFYALAIFLLAGATDVIDGYIARKFDLITKFGTVLDPLADKLMQLTVLICLTYSALIPMWITTIILVQEFGQIVTGIYMYFRERSTVVPSNRFGKSATVLFAVAILITIIYPESIASMVLVIGALALKLFALGTYIHDYYTHIKPNLPHN